jgi:hypothetical protein
LEIVLNKLLCLSQSETADFNAPVEITQNVVV